MKHAHGPTQHLLQRLSQKRIEPPALTGQTPVTQLIDEAFLSYNAGRLREACQKTMGTAEFHHLAGKYVAAHEDETGRRGKSLLAAAYRHAVPIFVSSPGDSSIGMNLAALMLEGSQLRIDPLRDVNQSAAIVWNAKAAGGLSSVLILGGGSPKNFILQTEPQIQEEIGRAHV